MEDFVKNIEKDTSDNVNKFKHCSTDWLSRLSISSCWCHADVGWGFVSHETSQLTKSKISEIIITKNLN